MDLSEENEKFILSLHKKNKSGYVIHKTLFEDSEDGPPIHKVYLEDDKAKKHPKIMKIVYLGENRTEKDKNLTINGIRKSYDVISIFGKFKCHSNHRFICYTDFFVYDTYKNKKPAALAYVYDMAKGMDLANVAECYTKSYIREILSDDNRTAKEQKSDTKLYKSDMTCPCEKNTGMPTTHTHMSFREIVNIAYSIFSSLAILQYNHVNHRDIKLDNVVYNASAPIEKRVKLIDFDFSTDICDGEPIGTPCYKSKTLLFYERNDICDAKIKWEYNDVVSTAITIFKLYCKELSDKSYFVFEKKLDKAPKDIQLKKDYLKKILKREMNFRKEVCSCYEEKDEKKFMEWMIQWMENDVAKTKLDGKDVTEILEKECGSYLHKKLTDDYRSEMKYYKSFK